MNECISTLTMRQTHTHYKQLLRNAATLLSSSPEDPDELQVCEIILVRCGQPPNGTHPGHRVDRPGGYCKPVLRNTHTPTHKHLYTQTRKRGTQAPQTSKYTQFHKLLKNPGSTDPGSLTVPPSLSF